MIHNCVICTRDFSSDEKLVKTGCCKYNFHEDCLREWGLKYHKKNSVAFRCPLCSLSLDINPLGGIYMHLDPDYSEELMADENGNINCINCIGCKNCKNCTNCVNCKRCVDCNDCNNCSKCTSCIQCNYSSKCYTCYACYRCYDCFRCAKCDNCYNCSSRYNGDGCLNCNRMKRCITNCVYTGSQF